jgi:hypothetical protein
MSAKQCKNPHSRNARYCTGDRHGHGHGHGHSHGHSHWIFIYIDLFIATMLPGHAGAESLDSCVHVVSGHKQRNKYTVTVTVTVTVTRLRQPIIE